MLKALIEENIRLNGGFVQAQKELQEIIFKTSNLYEAKVWIEDANGSPLLESFPSEERPEKLPANIYRKAKRGDVTINHIFRNNNKLFYMDVPLDPKVGDGFSLHIFYESKESNYLPQFKMELAGMISIMVVFTLSLLQSIRIKVNRFRESVLRISGGDLSHRVAIQGRGVVEDLGRAFNTMTDKLERMIASSREITANISHEIRTPLARIRIVEDLLRKRFDRGDFATYEKHLDNIREDIHILDDLTGRLLEFIKLDNYESPPKCEPFLPAELMVDLLLRFQPVIESKDLSVWKDIRFSAPYTGNKGALASAFLNILDNAFKYTRPHGTVTVRMSSEENSFIIRVINSFDRLDQKDLDLIFKPFERTLGVTTGSGLGLAITKKIVENHGGTIIALNSDEGFEIQIRFPLSK